MKEFQEEPVEADEAPHCKDCGCEMDWQECPDCEEGYSYHDCGEDICNCLDQKLNVICETCSSKGGWWVCNEPLCRKNQGGGKE